MSGKDRLCVPPSALAKRHSSDPAAKREALDRAYADAMREVARQFPDDLEAGTFFADSLMNLRPWNLWMADGTPQPGTEELVATLERVIAKNPNHPGALHLYIHAVEASREPGRAEAAADDERAALELEQAAAADRDARELAAREGEEKRVRDANRTDGDSVVWGADDGWLRSKSAGKGRR